MDSAQWLLWGKAFLDYSKALGNQIADGAVFVAGKTKEGALFVAEKTKEGASYIAEKTKPATDKIKEGASFVGEHMKSAYVDVKSKITGEPPVPQQQKGPEQEQQGPKDENQQENPIGANESVINQPSINSENLDNPQN